MGIFNKIFNGIGNKAKNNNSAPYGVGVDLDGNDYIFRHPEGTPGRAWEVASPWQKLKVILFVGGTLLLGFIKLVDFVASCGNVDEKGGKNKKK